MTTLVPGEAGAPWAHDQRHRLRHRQHRHHPGRPPPHQLSSDLRSVQLAAKQPQDVELPAAQLVDEPLLCWSAGWGTAGGEEGGCMVGGPAVADGGFEQAGHSRAGIEGRDRCRGRELPARQVGHPRPPGIPAQRVVTDAEDRRRWSRSTPRSLLCARNVPKSRTRFRPRSGPCPSPDSMVGRCVRARHACYSGNLKQSSGPIVARLCHRRRRAPQPRRPHPVRPLTHPTRMGLSAGRPRIPRPRRGLAG